MSISTSAPDHSEPVVFPPVIPLTAFLFGVLLGWIRPLAPLVGGTLRGELRVLGVLVLTIGIAGFAWMVVTMKRARTPIHNARTPTQLVDHGPFRFTRNPMYVFGTIAYAGLALALAQWWSLALLPIVVALTHYGVILREEQYLSRKFGRSYADYQRRVRRWL